MKFETTVEIAASQKVAWQTLTEVVRWPRWTESVEHIGWIGGDRVAVGNEALIKQPGMAASIWTVTELEDGVAFTWKSSAPGVATAGRHALRQLGPDRCAMTVGIRQSGVLAPLVALLVRKRTERYVTMEADGLKGEAERRFAEGR